MDKEKQHINTKFIDQSWHNMSELLDKEMPVQKRKRRFVWLWFLGLVALLTVVVLAYHYMFDENQDRPNKVEKIVQKEISSNDNQSFTNKKITSSAQVKINNKSPNQNPKGKNKSIQPNNFESSKKVKNAQRSKAIFKAKKIEGIVINQPTQVIKKTKETPQKVQETNSVFSEIGYNHQNWSSPNLSLQPLPAWSLFNIESAIEAITIIPIPIVHPVNKKSSKWRFGMYAGGLTNSIGSFRAGIHSNLKVNPKWTLHIGLGYARRIKNSSKNNFEDDSANIFSSNPDTTETEGFPGTSSSPVVGTNDPTNDQEEDLIEPIPYTNFHYFELPILFQYHFKSKWTIDVGGQIALLHGVRYKNGGENKFITDLGTFSNTSTRIQDNNSDVSKINFAVIGGISYQFSQKLSAYSNYHSSNNYIRNTQTSSEMEKRWQQLEVGVRYYFK